MTRTTSPYRFICKHCGRQWNTEGRTRTPAIQARHGKSNATGFIASASSTHEFGCAMKTPAERRETNRRDELRWLRDPPRASLIWNDPNHAGLKDGIAVPPEREQLIRDLWAKNRDRGVQTLRVGHSAFVVQWNPPLPPGYDWRADTRASIDVERFTFFRQGPAVVCEGIVLDAWQ